MFVSYVILPGMLHHRYKHLVSFSNVSKTTVTKQGTPGDPINIGLIGTSAEVAHILFMAGWYPADKRNILSLTHEVESVMIHRPYKDAPVSNLYFYDRKQDITFEQLVNNSPRRRHHVRFWRSVNLDISGRILWLGAATFDTSIGFSHLTGQLTHHIDPDIDAERDKLISDIGKTGLLGNVYEIEGVGWKMDGRNGGGDKYFTDGKIKIASITPSHPD
ncbi:MAG: LssY C-terminal domain-containing protein [Elusimicrobia bacterium]|nr:LssY C-terminal domain-containing protein [Elusimicrobiota bacterium]